MLLMGKSTISMAIFHGKLLVHQRVDHHLKNWKVDWKVNSLNRSSSETKKKQCLVHFNHGLWMVMGPICLEYMLKPSTKHYLLDRIIVSWLIYTLVLLARILSHVWQPANYYTIIHDSTSLCSGLPWFTHSLNACPSTYSGPPWHVRRGHIHVILSRQACLAEWP